MFNFVFDLECQAPDPGHSVATDGIEILLTESHELVLLDESTKIDVVCDIRNELNLRTEYQVLALKTKKVELDVE